MLPAMLLAPALLVMGPWYVDGDATCPGDGSDGAPFCTLQGAFDGAELAPGDEILVRTSAVPYDSARIGVTDSPPAISGTAEQPIVLRADDGHSPVLAGAIEIHHSAYWTVRDLVFHGAGDASPLFAIGVYTDGRNGEVHGILIEDNTILGFGGAPELDEGNYGSIGLIDVGSWTPDGTPMMVAPIIRNNHVRNSRGPAISVARASDALVEGNEIATLDCQLDLQYFDEAAMEYASRAGVVGIRVSDGPDARIAGNRVDDLDIAGCGPFDVDTFVVYGIWAERAVRVEIERNLVRDVGMQPGHGMGIAITGHSDDSSVHHNIVVDAERCGLCNGVLAADGGDDVRFVNNTVLGGGEHGIDVTRGERTFIGNNLVSGDFDAAIRILAVEDFTTVWAADANLYWDEGDGARVGQIGWTDPTDLATWQDDCGCDASSVVGDPMLPGQTAPENFTVSLGSPAIDAGSELTEVAGYNGAAPDVGALEAPVAVSASIADDEPTRVRLVVEHAGGSALAVDPDCLGLAVQIDGEGVAAVGCIAGTGEIIIDLAEPVWAGQGVVLVHAGATITDLARIGGLVSAFLPSFELGVDNNVQADAPADSGTTTEPEPGTGTSSPATSGVADTGGSDTGASADASYPDAGACECSSRASTVPAWTWLLLLCGRRSRRREQAA